MNFLIDLKAHLKLCWTVKSAVGPLFWVVRQQEKVDNDVDIGIVPSQGLVPPKLRISNLESSKISETKPKYSNASPAAKPSCPQDMTSITPQVSSQVTSEVVKGVITDQITITEWNFNAKCRAKFSFLAVY